MKVLVIHREEKLYKEFKNFCSSSNDSIFKNLFIDYAQDTSAKRYGNFEKYVQKMEKEGPEWNSVDNEVLEKVKPADIILTEWGCINSQVIDAGKQLKLIITIRSSCDNINVKYAEKKGIKVAFCPSRLADVVADMTIALMLSECRGIVRRNLVSTNGEWTEQDKYNDGSHAALCNLTIGLVGYGGIAKAVAKRLIQGFGCQNVLAYDAFTSQESIINDGVKPTELDSLCKNSDIISLHLRDTPETKNIIDRNKFKSMKNNAIVINTARSGIIEENALIEALQKGWIRGAGLDVYWKEPLPKDSPLLKMDNVTLMPHSAGITNDLIKNSVRLVAKVMRPLLEEINK